MSTGKRRASVAAIGLAVGLVLIVPTPASPSKEFRYSSSGGRRRRSCTTRRAATSLPRWSTRCPSTPKLTCLDDYVTRHTGVVPGLGHEADPEGQLSI